MYRTALLSLMLAAAPMLAANAQQATPANPATMPTWDQLSSSQRELLIAPIRERWERNPAERARIFERAQRWRSMTPEQRQQARHGMHRWQQMDPQKRERMRAMFERMRSMTPEQRKTMHEKLRSMTPEQRRAWIEQNATH